MKFAIPKSDFYKEGQKRFKNIIHAMTDKKVVEKIKKTGLPKSDFVIFSGMNYKGELLK